MNSFKTLLSIVGIVSTLSLTTGCVSLGIGEEEYSCKGYPDHPNCLSSREIYEQTNYKDTVYSPLDDKNETEDIVSDDLDSELDDDEYEYDEPTIKKTTKPITVVRATPNYVPRMEGGVLPIRSNSKIMRIWVSPWEDKGGALHSPGLVYMEIEGRRWTLGETNYNATKYLTPLSK